MLAGQLGPALAIAGEVASRASFPADEFRRGRAERIAAIQQDLDDPDTLAGFAIARAIFGRDHIYGRPVGGTVETIERLDRDSLVRFHGDRYRPAGAFLVVTGDATLADTEAMLESSFGAWAPGSAPEIHAPAVVEPGPTAIHLVDRSRATQSEVRLGTIGVPRSSPDFFPLVVLNTILGGSFTSRLNARLREAGGYTYGAFSGFSFRVGAGPFVAGAAVHTDATARALAESLEEIERMRQEAVPADELNRARRYLVLGLPRAFETNAGIASRVAETELYGLGDDFWSRYAGLMADVSADDVMSAAQRYLDPQRMAVAVVGDAGVVRGPLEQLGIGPVLINDDRS